MLLGFDLQGWITLIAGLLLALITLFVGYDHVDFFGGAALRLNQQVGVSLLLPPLHRRFLELIATELADLAGGSAV